MATRRIGELLVAEGLLTEGAVQRALGFQRVTGERVKLGSILLNWDLLAEDALLAALARIHRCPGVAWQALSAADVETVRLLPAARAIRLGAMPYQAENALVRVAFVNPSDLAAIDEVAVVTGRRVVPGVATEIRMMQAHQRFYGRHVPLEFRPILQKLERRSATPREGTDPAAVEPVEPPAAKAAWSAAPRPVHAIPVSTPPARPAPPVVPIRIPEFPAPDPLPRSPEGPELFGGEDSLAQWLEEALSAFRDPAWNPGRPTTRVTPPGGTRPPSRANEASPAPGARTSTDPVADMWQSPGGEPADAPVCEMWTGAARPETLSARMPEHALEEILRTVLAELPRVVFLRIEGDSIRGWRGKGPDVTPERVAALRIPLREATLFSRARESGRTYSGAVSKELWPSALADLLGSDPPDFALLPIRAVGERTVFLYADRLDGRLQHEDLVRLARAAVAAANALSGPAPAGARMRP